MPSQLRQEPRLVNVGLVGQQRCEPQLLRDLITACVMDYFFVLTVSAYSVLCIPLFSLLNFLLKPPY